MSAATRSKNLYRELALLLTLLIIPPLYLLSGPFSECAGGFAGGIEGGAGLPLDDSYIHLVYARNLLTKGFLTYDGMTPSAGTSSPLWTLWLAFLMWCRIPGEAAGMISGLAFHLLTGLALWRFLRDCPAFDTVSRILIPVICLGIPNVTWFSLTGMETSLFLFLAALLLLYTGTRNHRSVILPALLLPLVRPEGIFMVLTAILIMFEQRRTLKHPDSAPTGHWFQPLIALICGTGLLSLVYRLHTTNWIPQTSFSRRWIWNLPTEPLIVFPKGLATFFQDTFLFVRDFIVGWPPHHLAAAAKFPALPQGAGETISTLVTLVILVFGVLCCIRALYSKARPRSRIVLMLCLASLGFTLLFLPAAGGGGRYLAPCFLFAPLILCFGLAPAPGSRKRLWLLLLVTLFLLQVKGLFVWHAMHKDAVMHLKRAHGRAAAFLNEHIADGTLVAAFDIGKLQWESGCIIVDISGLVNHEAAGYVTAKTIPRYLDTKGIHLLAMVHTFGETQTDFGETQTDSGEAQTDSGEAQTDSGEAFCNELGFDRTMPGYRKLFTAAAWPHRYFMHAQALYNAYPVITIYAKDHYTADDTL